MNFNLKNIDWYKLHLYILMFCLMLNAILISFAILEARENLTLSEISSTATIVLIMFIGVFHFILRINLYNIENKIDKLQANFEQQSSVETSSKDKCKDVFSKVSSRVQKDMNQSTAPTRGKKNENKI